MILLIHSNNRAKVFVVAAAAFVVVVVVVVVVAAVVGCDRLICSQRSDQRGYDRFKNQSVSPSRSIVVLLTGSLRFMLLFCFIAILFAVNVFVAAVDVVLVFVICVGGGRSGRSQDFDCF